eukprot:scaffold156631_cov18-Tisochrysis_lutea.AAC.1
MVDTLRPEWTGQSCTCVHSLAWALRCSCLISPAMNPTPNLHFRSPTAPNWVILVIWSICTRRTPLQKELELRDPVVCEMQGFNRFLEEKINARGAKKWSLWHLGRKGKESAAHNWDNGLCAMDLELQMCACFGSEGRSLKAVQQVRTLVLG